MTIRAVLDSKGGTVVSVAAGSSVSEVVALLASRRIGAVPVMRGDEVVGIFSERDVIHGLDRGGAAFLNSPVEAAMTAPAIEVGPDLPVLAALSLMTQRRVRHLPVLAEGRIVGFVSIGDLVKFRISRIEAEAEAMRAYIQGS